MHIHIIFNPNQVIKPQGNKIVQYFKISNSVYGACKGVVFQGKNCFTKMASNFSDIDFGFT